MKTKNLKLSLSATLLAAFTLGAQAQTTLEWMTLGATRGADLAASAVSDTRVPSLPGVSKDAVAFTFALPADQNLQAATPHVAESREYWMEVSGAQLQAGVALKTTLPGALVRINPAGNAQLGGRAAGLALDPAGLEIRSTAGRFAAGTGMELLVSAEALQETGAPFLEGTTAFRLAPQVGAGILTLTAAQAAATERYVVHVFEPKSELKLRLQTEKSDYLHGQGLVIETSLADAASRLRFEQVEAFISAPSGRAWPLRVVRQKDGSYRGTLNVDGNEARPQGLWEVQLVARGRANGLEVVRGARTAFNVAATTAAFEGRAGIAREAKGLQIELPLMVGAAGRYEARGTLYGTSAKGELKPIAVAHFANWLEAGQGNLRLSFGADVLGDFKAPFEIRDLRLYDQGRMGLLHRQDLALVLP